VAPRRQAPIQQFLLPSTSGSATQTNVTEFLNDLEIELDVNTNVICLGDFNINTLNLNSTCMEFQSIVESYNCFFHNTSITRPSSNAILDHFITNNNETKCTIATIEIDSSDHNIILSSLDYIQNTKILGIIEIIYNI
jgi:hypothetical protein